MNTPLVLRSQQVCDPHPVLDHSPRLQAVAAIYGLTSPEVEWRGWRVRHRFACAHGHQFELTPLTLVARNWGGCTQCNSDAEMQLHFQRLRDKAIERGGVCLSKHYDGVRSFYRFRCAEGHEWETRGQAVMVGRWCPRCADDKLRMSIEDARTLAQDRGGECLSTEYQNNHTRLKWRCAKGHVWLAPFMAIRSGAWCRKCHNQANFPEDMKRLKEIAAERGGVCLSETYTGVSSHYRFRCAAGHEWEASAKKIREGRWCRQCAIEKTRFHIEDAQQTARDRGGECLSTEYESASKKLQWMCHRGHAWSACYTNIRRGSWCPVCANMEMITGRTSKVRRNYEIAGADLHEN